MNISNKSIYSGILLFLIACANSSCCLANADNQSSRKINNTILQDSDIVLIKSWFNDYDQIRRQAQMSPEQKRQADQILGRGLAIFLPGEEKLAAQNILGNLVYRYQIACQQMGNLRWLPATEQLHRGYYQYFSDAQNLFSDYLKLQNDLMAVDAKTGEPIARGLVERKQNLSLLDQNNKALDAQLRQQYGVAPYQY